MADPPGPSQEQMPLPQNDLQTVKRAISDGTIYLNESLITMTKAEYNRNMKMALSSGKFPKGLKLNILKPNAALQTKWESILTDCTKNLLGCLIDHYKDLIRTEMITQKDTQTKTQLTMSQANLSDTDQEFIGRLLREETHAAESSLLPLTGDLCLRLVGKVFVCMSPPSPSLTGDLC